MPGWLVDLAGRVFVPPTPPDLGLGLAGRITRAERIAREAFEVAYWTGVKDGLTVGVLASVVVVGLAILLRGKR